ncbi:alpha/beta fold hydrolase [Pseudomonas tolaasii]|uniref:alpha/beta hydrolase n=1 Tax=Pseudomonas tolaasii TaxID=29442 RepID=UPI0015A0EFB5|nr:alpha/beta fold hydrolase [Pseudomonas tolaasii]NVZ48483.1 alpha/beta fold hydrolase [Pseudomonas tolaasii]NWA48140.1 alpha/beta fold hydrolase [Pseudomonas tolaasii]
MTKDTQQLQGATGLQEVFVDRPAAVSAVAVVLHPHPLLGGNANHKVPFSIMRALTGAGVCVYRPNFRGVGESAGVFDAGELETRDILCLIKHVRAVEGPLPLLLVGFSFGAYVAAKTAVALNTAGTTYDDLVLCGLPSGEARDQRHYDTPDVSGACLIHAERDEHAPLHNTLRWAANNKTPVTVVADADHFFSGKLDIFSALIRDRALRACAPPRSCD